MNALLKIKTGQNVVMNVKVNYNKTPMIVAKSYHTDFGQSCMELKVSNFAISDSPSEVMEVKTSEPGYSVLGKSVTLFVFRGAKPTMMANLEQGVEIPHFIELTNARVVGHDTPILMVMTGAVSMETVEQVMMTNEMKTWINILENLARVKVEMKMKASFLRTLGDCWDKEMTWSHGTNFQSNFMTMEEVTPYMVKMVESRWSWSEIWRMFAMFSWEEMKYLVSHERGARIVATVLWNVVNKEAGVKEHSRLLTFVGGEPICWPTNSYQWIHEKC